MLIILLLYVLLIWLIFFKLKWLRFNWVFGSLAVMVGVAILTVFVGLLSCLTPSGKIEVIGRVTEVTPNVSGQITEIPVALNVRAAAWHVGRRHRFLRSCRSYRSTRQHPAVGQSVRDVSLIMARAVS